MSLLGVLLCLPINIRLPHYSNFLLLMTSPELNILLIKVFFFVFTKSLTYGFVVL